MRVLVVAEHDADGLRLGTLSAVEFANQVATHTNGTLECLVLGDQIDDVHVLRIVAQLL